MGCTLPSCQENGMENLCDNDNGLTKIPTDIRINYEAYQINRDLMQDMKNESGISLKNRADLQNNFVSTKKAGYFVNHTCEFTDVQNSSSTDICDKSPRNTLNSMSLYQRMQQLSPSQEVSDDHEPEQDKDDDWLQDSMVNRSLSSPVKSRPIPIGTSSNIGFDDNKLKLSKQVSASKEAAMDLLNRQEDEKLEFLTNQSRLEIRKVVSDDFNQGQWTFINEFEYLKDDKDSRIIVIEYRSEYLACGCLKIIENKVDEGEQKQKVCQIVKVELGERKLITVKRKLLTAIESLAILHQCTEIRLNNNKVNADLESLQLLNYRPMNGHKGSGAGESALFYKLI